MATGWTPERKARQAKLIRAWKPWEQSSGPKTDGGKERAKMNGYKGGTWKILKELSKTLKEQRNLVKDIDTK